jgi:metal-responsive CopG/Arc/MetJ family transcriptional regulator
MARFTIDLDKDLTDKLLEEKNRSGSTRVEVFREALKWYFQAKNHTREGYEVRAIKEGEPDRWYTFI